MKDKRQDWSEHFKYTIIYPPSPLLVQAVGYIENLHKAIDIGGGALKDSRFY